LPVANTFYRNLRARQIGLDVRDALLGPLRREAARHTLVESANQRGRIGIVGRRRYDGKGRDRLQRRANGLLVGAYAVLNRRGLIDPRGR